MFLRSMEVAIFRQMTMVIQVVWFYLVNFS
jgi:hypothetical protein